MWIHKIVNNQMFPFLTFLYISSILNLNSLFKLDICLWYLNTLSLN